MSLFMVPLIIVVVVTLWTVPVLSAVFKNGDNDTRDSKTNPVKSAAHQKLVNSSISETLTNKSQEIVKVDTPRSYLREESVAEARKKRPDIMTRILPMMIIPFMLQTAIIPMMLTMLKMMLLKSAFIGKMAIFLGFLNMFRNNKNQGGVYTHDINIGPSHHDHMDTKLEEEYYGYHGYDEYGPYVNRKRSVR